MIGGRTIRQFVRKMMLPKSRLARAKVQGSIMVLDMQSASTRDMCLNGIYEPETTRYIKSIIKKGETFIDIGANCGYYTLLLARLVGPSGKGFSFEPIPHLYRILRHNLETNNYPNIRSYQAAAYYSTGSAQFFVNRYHAASGLYARTWTKEIITVDTIALDEIQEIDNVDFIKIDVEGAELDVLKGMKNILKTNPQVKIILEFNPDNYRLAGYAPNDLLSQFSSWNSKGLDDNLLFWR